jgi:PAS domain S-box-containing protein
LMMEERKPKVEILEELGVVRSHIAQLEQAERKGISRKFEEPGQWFRRIFDNLAEGVLFADLENKRFITGNKAIYRMLGYEVEDFPNLEMSSICPPEDSYHLIRQFEKQANGDLVFRKDVPFRRKDGELFYADLISIPLTFSGKVYLISFLRETLAQRIKSVLQQATFPDSDASKLLTATEMKVLRLIIKGMSNKEIAKLLHRSIRTIENHRAHIMMKLSVNNPIELVKRAVTIGLVNLPREQRGG